MKNIILIVITLALPFFLIGQEAAGLKLLQLIKAHNEANDALLNGLIHQEATCWMDGQMADSSAQGVIRANFLFLNAVYPGASFQLRDMLSNDQLATAEWIFTDSTGMLGQGMVSIRLLEDQIAIIKLYSSKGSGGDTSPSDPVRKRSGGPKDDPAEQWYFYIRTSSGGFMDIPGLHFSQVLSCKVPELRGLFTADHLKGPFATRQEAGLQRSTEARQARELSINLHPVQVKCSN